MKLIIFQNILKYISDLIIVDADQDLSIFLNNGNRTYINQMTYSTEKNSTYKSLAYHTIGVHFNNRNGIFTSPIIFLINFDQHDAKPIDINDDGKMEIIIIDDFFNCCIDCLLITFKIKYSIDISFSLVNIC